MSEITITAAQARAIMHALSPLLRESDRRSAQGDSDLDNEQPIPTLHGVQLGHIRAAWWVRQWLGHVE